MRSPERGRSAPSAGGRPPAHSPDRSPSSGRCSCSRYRWSSSQPLSVPHPRASDYAGRLLQPRRRFSSSPPGSVGRQPRRDERSWPLGARATTCSGRRTARDTAGLLPRSKRAPRFAVTSHRSTSSLPRRRSSARTPRRTPATSRARTRGSAGSPVPSMPSGSRTSRSKWSGKPRIGRTSSGTPTRTGTSRAALHCAGYRPSTGC